jgi:diguanylate cyclase (GGDEF)-like protein
MDGQRTRGARDGVWARVLRAGRRARARLSPHAATGGLVVVLLVLTAFSVTAAVASARAATEARTSAAVSAWATEAVQSLAVEEDAAGALAVAPDDGSARAAYEEARAATRAAIVGTATSGAEGRDVLAGWMALHDRYAAAVGELVDMARRDPAAAARFEESRVDLYFDTLETMVTLEARDHWEMADAALGDVDRTQRLLLVLTPVVFGIGLLVVGWLTVVLSRSRRETVAQAEANRRQALHDALTGLPNRTLLRQRAGAALEGAAPGSVALMLIDLDRFKEVNDTLGHAYGDVVLQAVADRLSGAVRATDTVARLGGDEFAVLLPGVEGAAAAEDLATRALTALVGGIEADGVTLDVEASIGIAMAGEDGADVEALLRNADIAMYSAKDRSLGVCVYGSELDDHSPERLGLLGDLRRAMDAGELVLHWQPKVSLPGEEVRGVEALLRWHHPERGTIPPAVFIPAAERTPVIRPLTRYVLDAAVAQCARWRAEGRDLEVAVNVSARNLLDDRFVDDVLEVLARWDVPASSLELEVTESAIMADPSRAQLILGRLAEVGVTLSIDDFGAGYTSLSHLKDLPVHRLKIDRSFVAQMTSDRSDALIVRSVVELGRNLGLTTIAEGVEDRETLERLGDLGCDVAQGYLVCRPLPADQLERWFDSTRVATGA